MNARRVSARCPGAVAAALLLWLGHGAAWAQLAGQAAALPVDLWRVLLGTGLVAALAVAGLLALRRLAPGGMPGGRRGDAASVQVLARTALDARNAVVIVEAGRQRWLVGVGPQGPQLLAELSARAMDPATAAAAGAATSPGHGT